MQGNQLGFTGVVSKQGQKKTPAAASYCKLEISKESKQIKVDKEK